MIRARTERRRIFSNAMFALCAACAGVIVALLLAVSGYLVWIGAGSINAAFFTQIPTGDLNDPGGMRHAIEGTIILLGLASVVGIPLGVSAGVYLSEYQHEWLFAGPLRFIADVLTGVPSIVVGILGYELVVVPVAKMTSNSVSFSGYAGAAALAFIMIPIVARTTEEMLRLVPKSYREGSLALGASKAQTVLRVVLPTAFGSISTGVVLALARVAGETAPLLFTALGSRLLTRNPSEPFPSLTLQIYTYATGPYPEQKKLAWAGILVLLAMLFLVNIAIRLVATRHASTRLGKA
ncbi:MAG: phosphate ABC transporter permease PstA [Phycisphaerales bacterium]|nr:phosphate ABC transporter permease PstA [Phycisphaerales bacterium]